MKVYSGTSFADVYFELLSELHFGYDYDLKIRNQRVKEILNTSLVVENPLNNLFENEVRSSKVDYISKELLWYFSGNNTSEFIGKYAKMWDSLKNPDGTVNSAYGFRIFNIKNKAGLSQIDWVLESLKRDKHSRQAYLLFTDNNIQVFENKDIICTLYVIFHIRNNRLFMTVQMRSNDVIYGLPNDFAFFSVLHQYVHLKLKDTYSGLKIGSYTHFANSSHIYEKHFDVLEQMLESEFISRQLPKITNVNDWDNINLTKLDTNVNDSLLSFILNNLK